MSFGRIARLVVYFILSLVILRDYGIGALLLVGYVLFMLGMALLVGGKAPGVVMVSGILLLVLSFTSQVTGNYGVGTVITLRVVATLLFFGALVWALINAPEKRLTSS